MDRRELLKTAAGVLVLTAADSVKKGPACLHHGLYLMSEREYREMAVYVMRVSDIVSACFNECKKITT